MLLTESNALITAIKENNSSTEELGAFLRNKSNLNLLETSKVLKEKAKLLGLNGNKEHVEKKPKAEELQSPTTSHKISIPKKEDQKKCQEKSMSDRSVENIDIEKAICKLSENLIKLKTSPTSEDKLAFDKLCELKHEVTLQKYYA